MKNARRTKRQVKFRLGSLDLVLVSRFTHDDLKYLESLCGRSTASFAEDEPISDRLAYLLYKCAREHDPTLTKERILDEFEMPLHKQNQAVALVLCDVLGVIPTKEN